jgi:hypothetical protein
MFRFLHGPAGVLGMQCDGLLEFLASWVKGCLTKVENLSHRSLDSHVHVAMVYQSHLSGTTATRVACPSVLYPNVEEPQNIARFLPSLLTDNYESYIFFHC